MGFKRLDKSLTFADLTMKETLEHNPVCVRTRTGRHYGLKEHASVDTRYGFILAATLTPVPESDTQYFPYCTAFFRHRKNPSKMHTRIKDTLPD